jgi:hypothetical protein
MNMEPIPSTKSQLELVDDVDLTTIAVMNPTVAVIGIRPNISVLLARHIIHEANYTRLLGVRYVQLPTGLARLVFRLASVFWPMRLRRECDLPEVRLEMRQGIYYAKIVKDVILGEPRQIPLPVLEITAAQYHELMIARGRDLQEWIERRFSAPLADWCFGETDNPQSSRDAA